MWQARARLQKRDQRLATWDLRHILMLLLMLVFLTSSLSPVSADDHAVSAASFSSEIGFVEHASSIAKLCADDANEAHGTFCCNASVCSVCVPLIGSAAIARATAGEVVAVLPDAVHPGLASSPGFRPPSPSANI